VDVRGFALRSLDLRSHICSEAVGEVGQRPGDGELLTKAGKLGVGPAEAGASPRTALVVAELEESLGLGVVRVLVYLDLDVTGPYVRPAVRTESSTRTVRACCRAGGTSTGSSNRTRRRDGSLPRVPSSRR
jgi:hypothetical protein